MQPITSTNIEKVLASLEGHAGAEPMALEIERVERHAGALLSTALLGSLGEQPLEIRMAAAGDVTDGLASAGLAFALANRRGPTKVDGMRSPESLSPWRRTWTPGTRANWIALFPDEDASNQLFGPEAIGETDWEPDLFGPTFAAFVNPHRTGRVASRRHPLKRVFWPWIDRLMPRSLAQDRAKRREFVRDVGTLIDELIANISEHAAGSGPDVHSLVHAAVTRGQEADRLHLAFADTGAGIIRTLLPKLGISPAPEETYEEVLAAAFAGTLPGWGVGRGLGLPAVLDVATRGSAVLRVATGRCRLEADQHGLRSVAVEFDLRGTVVVVSLTLPRVA